MSLTRTSSVGVAWLLAQSLAAKATLFLSQIVLAWLLRPSDFGDIGLAYSITVIIGTLVGFGVDDVLQSRPRTLHRWAAPAFWVSLAISLVGGLVMLAAASLGASFYKNPHIFGLVAVLALSTPLSALSTVPGVVLRARFKFGFLAVYGTLETVGIQLFTILLAWGGMGAYSFVIPVPAAALIKAILFWRRAECGLAWKFHASLLSHTFRKGLTVFGQKLITAVRNNADYIVLGLIASHDVVGYYFFAFKLAAVPVYTFATSLITVLFPALAQLKESPERQLRASLSASRVITLAVIPLCFLQAGLALPLLHFLFGVKWMPSAPLFAILCVGMAFDVVPCVAGSLLNANGKFREQLHWSAMSLPFFLLLILAGGLRDSAEGVAIGVTVFYILFAPAYSWYALRQVGGTGKDVWDIYAMPVLCAAAATLSAMGAARWEPVRAHDLLAIIVITFWMSAVYLLLVRIFIPATLAETVEKIKVMLERKQGKHSGS